MSVHDGIAAIPQYLKIVRYYQGREPFIAYFADCLKAINNERTLQDPSLLSFMMS